MIVIVSSVIVLVCVRLLYGVSCFRFYITLIICGVYVAYSNGVIRKTSSNKGVFIGSLHARSIDVNLETGGRRSS